MSKDFKYHFRIALDEEIDKHDIRGIIHVLDKAIANIFEASEDGTAVIYHDLEGKHAYDFRMNRAVTEAEAPVACEATALAVSVSVQVAPPLSW